MVFNWVLRSLLREKLKSRRPCVPATRNLLNSLAGLGIRAFQWINFYRLNTEYCENTSRFRAFMSRTSARPVEISLSRTTCVKLNRLRISVGRFHSSIHKWGPALSPNCKSGTAEQTADHVLIACPIYRAPHGSRGLTVLNDKTRYWLNYHHCQHLIRKHSRLG